ncbi:MAG: response regulator transcription factor [Verrucomicrobiae bacterium]|nr:response regulator transcription factor [Verrucomicrobiae bacterium]
MNSSFTIGLVDDDAGMRKAVGRLLRSAGFGVAAYASAAEFLADTRQGSLDCLLLDLSLPGESGIELQARLNRRGWRVPIIFLTGEGDIPTSVSAIKAGAVDFLTKPVVDTDLFRAIDEALKLVRQQQGEAASLVEERARLDLLSPREREVLSHVITGKLNKQIAADLGISEQTVKVHRMRIAEKTGLPSVAEWVRLADRHGIVPAGAD